MHDSTNGTKRNVVLIIATITAFVVPFLVSSINIALPKIGIEFHMEAVVMSWVSTLYFLAIAIVQVPLGRMADIFGRKKLYALGLVISIIGSIMGALAGSVEVLLISRALQGIGAGMTFNNIIAILTSVYPSGMRGKALGISMAGTYGGLILGPLIGGYMTERFGWESIFVLSACLNLFLIILVYLFIKGEWREARGDKLDLTGSIIYSISVALFMYGFSMLPAYDAITIHMAGWILNIPGYAIFVIGVLGLLMFVRWESRIVSPVFDIHLFKTNRVFLFSNVATLINYLATFAVTFLLSLYLQYIKGLSPQGAGMVLIASAVPMTIITPIAGRLSDKIEPRLVAAAGLIVGCAALVLLIFLHNATPVWYVILALLLYGTGIGLFSSPNTNAIMGAVDKKMLGLASGTVGTMRTAGMMMSMGIMMILFTLFIGQQEITPAYYPQFLNSVRVGFGVFVALGIGGVVVQLAAKVKA